MTELLQLFNPLATLLIGLIVGFGLGTAFAYRNVDIKWVPRDERLAKKPVQFPTVKLNKTITGKDIDD